LKEIVHFISLKEGTDERREGGKTYLMLLLLLLLLLELERPTGREGELPSLAE